MFFLERAYTEFLGNWDRKTPAEKQKTNRLVETVYNTCPIGLAIQPVGPAMRPTAPAEYCLKRGYRNLVKASELMNRTAERLRKIENDPRTV